MRKFTKADKERRRAATLRRVEFERELKSWTLLIKRGRELVIAPFLFELCEFESVVYGSKFQGVSVRKNKHVGSTFESFLKEEGIFEEVDRRVRLASRQSRRDRNHSEHDS